MSVLNSFQFIEIRERGSIHEEDVAELRRAVYSDGEIDREEAELLIDLNSACPVQDPDWSEIYHEAITDYLVNQAEPSGYVTQPQAEWLISQLAPEGFLTRRKDIDLVIDVMDQARWVPEILIAFGLQQVAEAIEGEGSVLRPADAQAGQIDDSEVEMVRRMIYAFGGDGCVAVTRSEAEMLALVNDQLDPENISDAWVELYVKAMANFLLGASGYAVPTREEALRSEVWLEERGGLSPLEVLSSIAKLSLDDVIAAYRPQSIEETTIAKLDKERRVIVTEDELDADEAEWLVGRLGADAELNPADLALLSYIRENAVEIDPKVDELIDRHLPEAA
ncbi:MAG: hypothetical protein RIC14_15815 [Filomicrobium sp.]